MVKQYQATLETCLHSVYYHLCFADNVKLITPKKQQHEIRTSIQQARSWSRRWDLPLNASKSHRLSIGSTPDHHLVLSEETEGKLMAKCEQINDLGITVNSAFTPSTNVLTAANKARGMLYFIKRSFTCLTKEIFVPLYSVLVRPHLEYTIQASCLYLKKNIHRIERIQRAATTWMNGLWDLTYNMVFLGNLSNHLIHALWKLIRLASVFYLCISF